MCCYVWSYSLKGLLWGVAFDLVGNFDMGGCFPCFGSSSNKGDTAGVKKEVPKKDSFKEASVVQSHHPTRVSSGESHNKISLLSFINCFCLQFSTKFLYWGALNFVNFAFFHTFSWFSCPSSFFQIVGYFDPIHLRLCFHCFSWWNHLMAA